MIIEQVLVDRDQWPGGPFWVRGSIGLIIYQFEIDVSSFFICLYFHKIC